METEDNKITAGTQTDNSQLETNEHCVSRVNPKIVSQEEYAPNEEPPTKINDYGCYSGHNLPSNIDGVRRGHTAVPPKTTKSARPPLPGKMET